MVYVKLSSNGVMKEGERLMYPEAYIQYLVQFHAHRDFFECHEILEEHWKENDIKNRYSPWVGLIQIAVGLYHYRRENFRGAEKILKNAYTILEQNPDHLRRLGLDFDKLLNVTHDCLLHVLERKDYRDINLPLTDQALIERCKQESAHQHVTWLAESDLRNKHLVHRHILRDRTEIDEERLRQKQLKETTRKLSR